MTIKKMDIDMFEHFINEKNVSKENEIQLTEEQTLSLYQSGINELIYLNDMFDNIMKLLRIKMNETSFGFALMDTVEFINFEESIKYYLNTVLPSLMEGNYDSIINNIEVDDVTNFTESLDSLRLLFFQELAQKYL